MSTYNRQSFLATYGDQALVTGGTQVVTDKSSGDVVFNVRTGQLVVWNPDTNLALDAADIPTATKVAIGVGMGPKNGMANDILHIGGDKFDFCSTNISASVTAPTCGYPQIVDLFFDCTECDEVYTLEVLLDDSLVRSRFQVNEWAKYPFQIVTECYSCDSCDPAHNCKEISCKLVDAINGKTNPDVMKLTRFINSDSAYQYQPFSAARLFTGAVASKEFCLSRADLPCETCGAVGGITGVDIDGNAVVFTNTTDPADNTITYEEQLSSIIDQTNAALDLYAPGGRAVLRPALGKCCEDVIEINSSATAIHFDRPAGAGGQLDPKREYNPYTAKIQSAICKDDAASQTTFACGVRLFAHAYDIAHDPAYPPNLSVPNTWSRTLDVQFVGDGWKYKNFHAEIREEQVLPVGLGYVYKDKAHYGQHKGGSARNFRYSNKRIGRLGLPDAASRAVNAPNLIDDKERYCVWNLMSTKGMRNGNHNGADVWNLSPTWLLIPDGDTTTVNAWTPVLVALQARGVCSGSIPNVVCGNASDDYMSTTPQVGGLAVSFDVSTNDSIVAACTGVSGTMTYALVAKSDNITVTNVAETFDVTAVSSQVGGEDFYFIYEAFCNGLSAGKATVTGRTIPA